MMRSRIGGVAAGVVAVAVVTATGWTASRVNAQAPIAAKFEVASVKASTRPDGARGIVEDQGRFTARGVLVIDLIRYAYGFSTIDLSSQVVGGPPWIGVDRFDIVATADGSPTLAMLKALLKDRFKVVVRVEHKEASVYALVLDRQDGRLGRAIHRSTSECQGAGVTLPRTSSGGIGAVAFADDRVPTRVKARASPKSRGRSGTSPPQAVWSAIAPG